MKFKLMKIPHALIISSIIKIWSFLIGTVFILIGLIGLAAPILPGIPFLLFGLSLYAKSFQSFDNWLINKDLKPYLNFIYFIKSLYGFIFQQFRKLFAKIKSPDRIL